MYNLSIHLSNYRGGPDNQREGYTGGRQLIINLPIYLSIYLYISIYLSIYLSRFDLEDQMASEEIVDYLSIYLAIVEDQITILKDIQEDVN